MTMLLNGFFVTMSRKILFRGKQIDDGQWIFGSYVDQYGTYEIYLPDGTDSEYGSDHYIVLPSTVGQYIGLTDNDGIEIFEGDILSFTDTNLDYTWTGVIKFGNPNGEYNWGWQIVPIGDVDVNTDILLWVDMELPDAKCEIIGNIHDNPGLLEVWRYIMDKKFIDADSVVKKIFSLGMASNAYGIGLKHGYDNAIRVINECPSADVQEVRHGKWNKSYIDGTLVEEGFVCSCCDMWNVEKSHYCPNCGAKIDKESE